MVSCCVYLQRLESSCRLVSVEEVSAVVELLQESSQWFPGGSKQIKVLDIPREREGEERKRVSLTLYLISLSLVPMLPLLFVLYICK